MSTERQSVTVRIVDAHDLVELIRRLRFQAEDHKRLSGTLRRQAQRDHETLAFLYDLAERNGIPIPTEPQEAQS